MLLLSGGTGINLTPPPATIMRSDICSVLISHLLCSGFLYQLTGISPILALFPHDLVRLVAAEVVPFFGNNSY